MTNALARCAVTVAVLLPVAAFAEPIKLKMAYFSSDQEPPYVSLMEPFAEAVNRDAGGILEIVPYPGGVLGRNYSQQVQQVLDGVADMAWINPNLTPERFPDNEALEFPGLFRDLREASLVFSRLVAAGRLRGYEDFFVIAAGANHSLIINTRPPVEQLSDLRGKTLRVNNQIEGSALKSVGIKPVVVAVNEAALAISRGTLDGAVVSPNALFAYGVSRITRFHYDVPLGAAPLAFLMNRQKFESLPKAGQDVIRKYSGEKATEQFIATYDASNTQVMNDLKADPNRHVIEPTPADLDVLHTVFKSGIERWRNEDPRNPQLWNAVKAEIAKLRSGD
ncbi:MAG TPA: TRAP transporter substrate-binding protein DctP [Xanthobacteraceae bacterium]|nr:TRAP transporter substrate-binding protein DctP [Xanthobacteraceae bacterium]